MADQIAMIPTDPQWETKEGGGIGPRHPEPPRTFLDRVLDLKLPAAEIERYLEMHERLMDRAAAQEYAEAMAACQAEMPGILKDAVNAHTQKRYASWEALNRIIRPIYTRHGFSLSFNEEPIDKPTEIRVVCFVRHRGGHCIRHQGDFPKDGTGSQGNKSSMNALQAVGSTRSYAKRYLAKDIFALAEADEDNDGQSQDAGLDEADLALLGLWVTRAAKARNITYDAQLKSVLAFCEVSKPEEMPRERFLTAINGLKKVVADDLAAKQKNGGPG